MQTKICAMCNTEKPLNDFYRRKERKGGYGVRSKCKECESELRKQRYAENREEELVKMRQWQQDNQEHLKDYRRKYERTPQGRARQKRYNESEHGQEKRLEYQRSEARREASRRWDRANRHKKLAVLHVYRAKQQGTLIQPPACEHCGLETGDLHAHHYKGYKPEYHLDVVWLCVPCHEKVHHNLKD